MSNPQTNGQLATGKLILDVFKFVAPVVLALAAGYGAVKFTSGAEQEEMRQVKIEVAELKRGMEHDREHEVTREELTAYLAGITRTLEQIQDDLRALRRR